MQKTLLLAACVVIGLCLQSLASAKRPDAFTYYYFDGHSFIAGQPPSGTQFIAVRGGYLPVVTSQPVTDGSRLGPDQGAVAGICYLQSSGGKLAGHSGYVPTPLPVEIKTGDRVVTTIKPDKNGYFVAPLPAGKYLVTCGIAASEILIEKGLTILVPLRTGKRMVD